MTTITLPRAVVEQALEAMRRAVPTGKITLYEWDKAMAELDAALAQQAEPVEPVAPVAEAATTQQQLADTPPSDYRRSYLDGYFDGFAIGKREGRIEAEDAAKQAEPVEPVAWIESPHGVIRANPSYKFTFPSQLLHWRIPLYTAPPQRKPLTDEEIERICMTYQSPRQAVRAVERAHKIGDNT